MTCWYQLARGTALAAAITFAGVGVASAQEAPPKPDAISNGELESFVESQFDITDLAQEWEQRIGETQDQQKAQQLQQQAQQAYADAVRDNGLTVKRYNQIYLSAQQHEELQERLRSIRAEVEESR